RASGIGAALPVLCTSRLVHRLGADPGRRGLVGQREEEALGFGVTALTEVGAPELEPHLFPLVLRAVAGGEVRLEPGSAAGQVAVTQVEAADAEAIGRGEARQLAQLPRRIDGGRGAGAGFHRASVR